MEKHKIIGISSSLYAVLLEGDKVQMCQEHWSGKGQDTKIFFTKEEILKLADELRNVEL